MKTYKQSTIAERLDRAKEILTLAQSDPEISTVLANYGFVEARFSDGTLRLDTASLRETDQRAHLGAQVTATREMNAQYSSMLTKFRTDRRVVQTVLRDNRELYEGLRLHLSIEDSREGFLRQAIHFYQEIMAQADVMTALADEYNLTEAVFTARQSELEAFQEARQQQQLMIGKAQVATQQRRAAMDELDTYMNELIGVAKVAFKNNERQLRKLGLTVALKD